MNFLSIALILLCSLFLPVKDSSRYESVGTATIEEILTSFLNESIAFNKYVSDIFVKDVTSDIPEV